MQNPSAGIHAYRTGGYSPRTLAIVGIVLAIHLAALWALANGLAPMIVKVIHDSDFTGVIIPKNNDSPLPLPPVPRPWMHRPEKPAATPPTIPEAGPGDRGIATAPPGPGNAIADTVATPIYATHTIPPYPPLARRLGQEGTVELRIAVAPDGSVADVAIVKSSGMQTLDRTAADWVKAHWRYSPAIKGGTAVASTVLAAVTFNLQSGR